MVFCENCKYYILKEMRESGFYWVNKSCFLYKDLYVGNMEGNCLNYKRKWWKFWVKEK